ncbi:SDR family oxidoreductase [Salipiger sp. 1_MG-2023]|uniref:SDR family NAD(P)-dependent oxidoreductase n=1 Tax=Salipiger sp. 1_MG-2023 TaxID=3062665 RepID=UPI0026E30FA4|nr:SDR family oxidoreductase [Salipiger sp. 1_MG-2023]MDO6586088.1 SDR family oxidoreductase [Salipiger sp. 1_MG-2023]
MGGRIGFDFSGQRVLVTGASSGIGLGIARAFHAAGATLTVLADSPAIHDTALPGARAIQCDISDAEAVSAALADTGPLDVLVNNAGLERPTPLIPGRDETFERVLAVNVTGTRNVTGALRDRLSEGASVILTASIWARTAVPEFAAYVASKHATLGLTRTWAHELGPRGIRVNAVCPGWVRTGPAMNSLREMARASNRSEAEVAAELSAAQVLPGLMDPDDIAGLYLYLASDGAANITGQAITIDRGEVMA